jgi:hypothetical protein
MVSRTLKGKFEVEGQTIDYKITLKGPRAELEKILPFIENRMIRKQSANS